METLWTTPVTMNHLRMLLSASAKCFIGSLETNATELEEAQQG